MGFSFVRTKGLSLSWASHIWDFRQPWEVPLLLGKSLPPVFLWIQNILILREFGKIATSLSLIFIFIGIKFDVSSTQSTTRASGFMGGSKCSRIDMGITLLLMSLILQFIQSQISISGSVIYFSISVQDLGSYHWTNINTRIQPLSQNISSIKKRDSFILEHNPIKLVMFTKKD